MKYLRNLQIRKKFILAFGLLFILMITGGAVTYSFISRITEYKEVKNDVANIIIDLNKANKAEKDFLLDGWKKPVFLEKGNSKQTVLFNQYLNDIKENINLQLQDEYVEDLGIKNQLSNLHDAVNFYQKKFNELKNKLKVRGFKDHGLEGEMRAYVHELQDTKSAEEQVFAYSLRRHEKDFGLRKDLKYVDRLHKTASEYISFIKTANQSEFPHFTEKYKQNSISIINAYTKHFDKIVQADIAIGLTENSGLRLEIEKVLRSIDPKVEALYKQINERNEALNQKASVIIGCTIMLILLLSIFSIQLLRKTVSKPIRLLDKIVNEVLAGDFSAGNNLLSNKTKDEIGSLSRNFGQMLENLKKNLELIKEKNQDLEEKAKADEIRNWKTSGLAQFTDLIKDNYSSLEAFGSKFLSELVKYMKANQAIFFAINEDEELMEAKACYAFNRKKMAKAKILKGQGLAGQAWIEGDYIHLTDVPDAYVNIRSGLGDAAPRSVLIIPVKSDDKVIGIIEIASFNAFASAEIDFLNELGSKIGSTLQSFKLQQQTEGLLKNSQEMTEQLQAQEEEMRQNMEELEATQEEMQRNSDQLQQQLQTNERKKLVYHSLIQKVYDGVIVLNDQMRVEIVNHYACDIMGYAEEELFDKKITYSFESKLLDELNSIHNDPNYLVKGLSSVAKGIIRDKNGAEIEIEYVISKIDLDQRTVYTVLFNKRSIKKIAKLVKN